MMDRTIGLGATIAIAAIAGCLQQHDPQLVETRAEDCYTCHQPEYEAAGRVPLGSLGCIQPVVPLHSPGQPTTCGSCHQTTAWCPALEGIHPESEFPIAGGPHRMPCLDCHVPSLGPSTEGMNVSCIGCHTGEHSMARMADKHDEEREYMWNPNRPGFCLDCHPRGRGD
jgi:hypothetical protein